MTHPYKHVLQAVANGEQVQWKDDAGGWHDQSSYSVLLTVANRNYELERYRVKPRTITIGTFEVPEPVRTAPEMGQTYFLADTTSDEGVTKWSWDGGDTDLRWLKRGVIHIDEGAALLHVEALLSFTKRGEA